MTDPLDLLQLKPLHRLMDELHKLIQGRLWAKVMVGMVAGIIFGTLIGPTLGYVKPQTAHVIASWVALPGTIFLTLIQMMVVPLVFASIIRGLAQSTDMSQLKKLGLGAVAFFVVATALSTLLGLGLGSLIKPGEHISKDLVKSSLANTQQSAPDTPDFPTLSEIPDKVIQVLPVNPLNAMASGEMLQVILFAIVVGIALISIPTEKSLPLYDVLGAIQEVCMKVVSWAMLLAPLAVFGLIAKLTSSVGLDVLGGIGIYALTVLLGLTILFFFYGILAAWLSPLDFKTFFKKIRGVTLLAFSTSSSAAVMPLSIQTAEENLNVRPSVARFLIPLGATINMNGTALYQGVATVFLAQVYEVPLDTSSLLFVVVMATAASIGSPAAPGAGIIILAMVLNSAGIPPSGIALLLGVDRLLDMCRTSVNVTSDLTACLVLDKFTAPDQSAVSDAPSTSP